MKIMYLAFEGFDTQNGTNHLALAMMDDFLKAGAEVYLVSSHSAGLAEDIPDVLNGRKGFTYDIINRDKVEKTNFVHRYLDGVRYALNCKKRWKKHVDSVDVVILQSTPTAVISSLLLKLFYRKTVVFNSFDVFPDGLYHNGAIKNKLIYSMFHWMQKSVYKNSKKIIAISQDMKTTLVSNGVPESKIEIVHNWYDADAVRYIPEEDNRFIKKFDIDTEKFIVQYAGNFGYTFDYKMVLDVAEQLKCEPDIEIHMIGAGGFENKFKAEADERDLTNIRFFPWQPLDMISDVYSACSVELIPLTKSVIYNSFPSKGSLLMACGKCIVCAVEDDSDYFRSINANHVGVCVSRDNPNKLAEAILYLKNNPEQLRVIERNAVGYGREQYSSTVNLSKLRKIIFEII